MSLGTRALGAAVVGAVVIAAGLAALQPGQSRRWPDNPQPDQRLYITAKVSSNPGEVSLNATVGANPTTPIDMAQGWVYAKTAWVKTFGPFKRGDHFIIVVTAPNSRVWTRCAVQTVGKTQIRRPPYEVFGKEGTAACSINAGD